MKMIGFQQRYIAERLKMQALDLRGVPTPPLVDDCVMWLLRTPSAGIDAFDADDTDPLTWEDTDVPSAFCTAWSLYETDTGTIRRSKQYDEDDNQIELLVANLAPQAIPGDRWLGATRMIGGALLATWLACVEE